jgi:hypothetical protein
MPSPSTIYRGRRKLRADAAAANGGPDPETASGLRHFVEMRAKIAQRAPLHKMTMIRMMMTRLIAKMNLMK